MTALFTEILKLQNPDYDNTKNLNLDRLLKYIYIESVAGEGNKFDMLRILILDNKFLKCCDVDKALETMCRAQKTLHTLMRLCKRINMKYARTYDYNMDMAMIPLSDYKPHLIVTLLENNTKYNFKLGDMITLIHKRLCNSSSFFPEPLEIVNPYTNIPLSYSSLYKLYFTIKESNYTMPTLFHQFFMCHFDLSHFLDFNECLLKENIIKESDRTATLHQKQKRLSAMMYMYRNYFSYRQYIENRESVLEKVSSLHIHYLRAKYSLNPNVRFVSERTIKSTLKRMRLDTTYAKQDNGYRRIVSDIDSSTQQNPFLFGQLNEIHTDDFDDDETDDELHDDEDDEEAQDEGTVTDHDTHAQELFSIDTTVSSINNWINTMSDVSFNVIAEASSESGGNTDEYDAIISVTPEHDGDPDEVNRAMDILAQHLTTHTAPTQLHIDMMSSVVREVLGDEAADVYEETLE